MPKSWTPISVDRDRHPYRHYLLFQMHKVDRLVEYVRRQEAIGRSVSAEELVECLADGEVSRLEAPAPLGRGRQLSDADQDYIDSCSAELVQRLLNELEVFVFRYPFEHGFYGASSWLRKVKVHDDWWMHRRMVFLLWPVLWYIGLAIYVSNWVYVRILRCSRKPIY